MKNINKTRVRIVDVTKNLLIATLLLTAAPRVGEVVVVPQKGEYLVSCIIHLGKDLVAHCELLADVLKREKPNG